MKTILVVEDSVDVRFLYQCALESEEYKIVLAGTGQEALDSIQQGSIPNLILLDLTLPDISGQELFEKLHAMPELKATKIVLVSGHDDIANTSKALGSDGFLRKPFDLERLCATVDQSFQA